MDNRILRLAAVSVIVVGTVASCVHVDDDQQIGTPVRVIHMSDLESEEQGEVTVTGDSHGIKNGQMPVGPTEAATGTVIRIDSSVFGVVEAFVWVDRMPGTGNSVPKLRGSIVVAEKTGVPWPDSVVIVAVRYRLEDGRIGEAKYEVRELPDGALRSIAFDSGVEFDPEESITVLITLRQRESLEERTLRVENPVISITY